MHEDVAGSHAHRPTRQPKAITYQQRVECKHNIAPEYVHLKHHNHVPHTVEERPEACAEPTEVCAPPPLPVARLQQQVGLQAGQECDHRQKQVEVNEVEEEHADHVRAPHTGQHVVEFAHNHAEHQETHHQRTEARVEVPGLWGHFSAHTVDLERGLVI